MLYFPVWEISQDFTLSFRGKYNIFSYSLSSSFHSLSLCLSLSLSLYIFLSPLSPSLYLSFYLSSSLSPSLSLLSIILFGVSNGRFRRSLFIQNQPISLPNVFSPIKSTFTHYFLYNKNKPVLFQKLCNQLKNAFTKQ